MPDPVAAIDSRLEPFILITEVHRGHRLADRIFKRKVGQPTPDFGHHILALYHHDEFNWLPVTYVKYWAHGEVMLSGGACTDGRVLRMMSSEQQAAVRESGGILVSAMRYAELLFSADKPGTFGYCGDARAWEVLDQVGYERLDHPHLIVRWHNRPGPEKVSDLIEDVSRLGPF